MVSLFKLVYARMLFYYIKITFYCPGFTHKTRILQCENIAIFNEVTVLVYGEILNIFIRKAKRLP